MTCLFKCNSGNITKTCVPSWDKQSSMSEPFQAFVALNTFRIKGGKHQSSLC